jgi:glycosyltransferase involved in cell wall biosynthesis
VDPQRRRQRKKMFASNAALGSDRLRVLCIIETLDLGGGAEQLLVGLLPALRSYGYECELATLRDHPNDIGHHLENQGIIVHRLHLAHSWNFPSGLSKLLSLHKTRPFDLFWGHMFDGNLYATLLGRFLWNTRSIITLHTEGYSGSPPKKVRRRLFVWLEKTLLALATLKVAVSKAVADDFERFFGWSDIAVIHNGVVFSESSPLLDLPLRRQIREEHRVSEDEFMIVTPSRFVGKKGHAVLLDALSLLRREKSWTPRLVARGFVTPLLDQLRTQADELGLSASVELGPAIAHDQILSLMQAADAVVIPSLKEPFGIAAAEAMLLGTPVIVTRVDGFLELVGESEGALMVPPGDPKSLAEAIWSLKIDPELRLRVAECGRRRVSENFEISVCASKWARLFDLAA